MLAGRRRICLAILVAAAATTRWRLRRRMGNCCGAEKPSHKAQVVNNLNRKQNQREAAWSSTGTLALRDSKLKVLVLFTADKRAVSTLTGVKSLTTA